MGEFTVQSQIEFLRRRRHGIASRFRFLKDSQNGYLIIYELTEKFLLNRQWDSTIGARVEKFVFDAPDDFDFSDIIFDGIRGDLINPDNSFKRYALSTETTPTANENRFRFSVTADFGDTTQIVGIASPIDPEPDPSPEDPLAGRYTHEQTVPSTEWVINHNLGEMPFVQVFVNGIIVAIIDARHITVNQTRVYFAEPTAGIARCI